MRVVIALLFLLSAQIAVAQPTPQQLARKYTDAGLAAQRAGEYEAAIGFYSKAYAQIPHPVLLFNMAQAYRLGGMPRQAYDHYQRYLAAEPDGVHAPLAREHAAALAEILAAEDARAEAARAEAARAESRARREDAVARTIEAERRVEEARLAAAVERAEKVERRRERERRYGVRPSAPAPEVSVDEAAAARRTLRRKYAYGVGGAGVAALAVSLYVGSRARSTWAAAHEFGVCNASNQCTPEGLDRIDDAQGQARIATAFGLVGIAAGAAGVYLYLSAREPRPATALTAAPLLTPSGAGLVLSGGF